MSYNLTLGCSSKLGMGQWLPRAQAAKESLFWGLRMHWELGYERAL